VLPFLVSMLPTGARLGPDDSPSRAGVKRCNDRARLASLWAQKSSDYEGQRR